MLGITNTQCSKALTLHAKSNKVALCCRETAAHQIKRLVDVISWQATLGEIQSALILHERDVP